jgi:hypothetical protein
MTNISGRVEHMHTRVAGAPAQTISAERAARFLRSGMWLDYGTSLCQPLERQAYEHRLIPRGVSF